MKITRARSAPVTRTAPTEPARPAAPAAAPSPARAVLERRRFLSGFMSAGAAAAVSPFVPLLESRGEAAGLPRRLLIFATNTGMTGRYPANWRPDGADTSFSFPAGSILEALAPHRDKLVVIQGLDMMSYRDGPQIGGHPTGNLNMLTATPGLSGTEFGGGGPDRGGWAGGPSVDQFIGQGAGKDTPFPALLLGIRVGGRATPHSRISFTGPSLPVPPENSPYAAFDRVFGGAVAGAAGDPALLERLRNEQKSVLDVVKQDLAAVRARMGAAGRQKLDAHVTALRAVETRLSRPLAPVGESCKKPALGAPINFMDEKNIPAVGDLHMRLATAALACGQTKVITLQWGDAPSGHRMSFLPQPLSNGWHSLSHAPTTDARAQDDLERAARWLTSQLKALLDMLKAIPEGTGTLLDNTAVLWCTENGRSNNHDWRNMPYVLAGGMGGAFRTGRFLSFTPALPHNRLLTSLCHGMGLSVATFGSPKYGTGPLPGLG